MNLVKHSPNHCQWCGKRMPRRKGKLFHHATCRVASSRSEHPNDLIARLVALQDEIAELMQHDGWDVFPVDAKFASSIIESSRELNQKLHTARLSNLEENEDTK